MGILTWIIVGAIAGWIAGLIGNIIIGIIGAFVGGWLSSSILNLPYAVTGFNLVSVLVAIAGAVVVLFVLSLFKR